MIVAMGPNREIGLENKLLWHISEDLKNFKKITTGKAVVMGRKTFESIGKPLPNRLNIVLSRDLNLKIAGAEVITDPMSAFELALEYNEGEDSELIVIGGAEIYKIYLPFAQKIYLTEVDFNGNADAFFPKLEMGEWSEVENQKFDQFRFKIIDRI